MPSPVDPPNPDLPPPTPRSGRWARLLVICRAHRGRTILIGLGTGLVLAAPFVDAVLAGPMRSWAERTMNAQLHGYTLHIGRVRPHLWRLAFDLDDLILLQDSHPTPSVANIGALQFSLLFSELLHFKVAGNLTILRPNFHINLAQIQEEATAHVSLQGRGWQQAVESVYPIKLDRVNLQDGSLLYLSAGSADKPIQLTKVYLSAQNVRNIAAAKSTYPSPVDLQGQLFDTGQVTFHGAADFLREPWAAARGEIKLNRVPLDRLNPLAQDYQVRTTGGLLSLVGAVEYSPELQSAHLSSVTLEDLHLDYVTSKATRVAERRHGRQAALLARKVRNAPHLMLQVDSLKLHRAQVGFVDARAKPAYRVFFSDMDLTLLNLSNQATSGASEFSARGRFMGSGRTQLSGRFHSAARSADFQVHLELAEARLPDLNGFLRAHTGVDVAQGLFSVYSEITVKNGHLDGYLKPLVKNLRVYDRQKDRAKPFGKRVELHLLQFLATLFKNHSTRAVATVIHLSGSTANPRIGEWAAIRSMIANGLFRAILPGFLEPPPAPASAKKQPASSP